MKKSHAMGRGNTHDGRADRSTRQALFICSNVLPIRLFPSPMLSLGLILLTAFTFGTLFVTLLPILLLGAITAAAGTRSGGRPRYG